ncbi:3-oxoacyl-ACP synthase [Streptomyces cocklensis]|nr:3-oxoacyl-[acyl-carrier-protein] synthase III C-terminal domain-containing protein [Actinacidiphila cocklensis]MDD1062485.1 3-oxoacyl-ACP synthase [Actinacidiphila cocklensis]
MAMRPTVLERVEAYLPARSVDVQQVAADMGLSRHQARLMHRVHGLDVLHDDPGLGLYDLVLEPARRVLAALPDPSVVRYLLYAHTIQEVTPAHVDAAADLGRLLGLPDAECFALTQQNCASGLAAVDAAGELLRADGDPQAKALVVTGEKPFSKLARLIANTTVMGEASAAALVGLAPRGFAVRGYAVRTDGRFCEGVRMTTQAAQDFGDSYAAGLAAVVHEALGQADLGLSDLVTIVPHNVNRSSWLRVAKELGIGPERIHLDGVARYGHCFCSDPFLNLVALREQQGLVEGGHYLFAAVGLGATYAAMVIEHLGG